MDTASFVTDNFSALVSLRPSSDPWWTSRSEGKPVFWMNVDKQAVTSPDLREIARYFLQLANEMDGRKPPTLGPQHEQILKHIAEKGSISNVEAQAVYRIRSLPRRIKDLKELGYSFKTEMRKDPTGQRYARYSFA
jgi:hypothetical protein